MLKEYYDIIGNFITTYDIEILWIVIILTALRQLKKLLKGTWNEPHIHTDDGEKFLIKTKRDKINKMDIAMVLFVGVGSFLIVYYTYYFMALRELMHLLGTSIMIFIGVFSISPSIEIAINPDKIILNDKKFKRDQIQSITLWDDEIVVKKINGKEKKTELDFTEKSFDTVLSMITSLKKFCQLNAIELIDRFEYEKEKNEMLFPNTFKENDEFVIDSKV